MFGFFTAGGGAVILERFLQFSLKSWIPFVTLDMDVNIFLSLGKQIKSKRVAWNC